MTITPFFARRRFFFIFVCEKQEPQPSRFKILLFRKPFDVLNLKTSF